MNRTFMRVRFIKLFEEARLKIGFTQIKISLCLYKPPRALKSKDAARRSNKDGKRETNQEPLVVRSSCLVFLGRLRNSSTATTATAASARISFSLPHSF